ncbi:MAG: cation:proton antiporter, partial [Rubripirellula sp.]
VVHDLILKDFLLRFIAGVVIGVVFGFVLDFILRREWISKGHTNVFVLAMAMLNFGIANLVIVESGLLSVTVAGLVLGSRKSDPIRDIVTYKVELKDFLIGLLFVLLAANLDLNSFLEYGWKLVVAVVVIMLLIRPLNVFASTHGSQLQNNEKLFLSWIAPRGIVAASMASIFALELSNLGVENAVFLETFTYSVIAGTVLVQGLSAGAVARVLNVTRPIPSGWIIVGAHAAGRSVAKFFMQNGVSVVLIDTNAREVREAKREGLFALSEDATQLEPDASSMLYGCGNLLAMTANPDLNRMLCRRWSEFLEGKILRWEHAGYETDGNKHLLVGDRIWETLPLNRWMQPGSEMPPLVVQSNPPATVDGILLAAADGVVTTNPNLEGANEGTQWLVLEPGDQPHGLELPLTAQNVVFMEHEDLREMYRAMLLHLKDQLPNIDTEAILEEMWQREADYTSILGHGIALPHVWTNRVDKATLMVACPSGPQQEMLCPLTNSNIRIVFMLISPEGKPDEHLAHLSHIARLVGTEAKRQSLLESQSASELYDAIARS